ncbi:hypothetical protein A3J43_04370 [Candidatus Uhrbacteria bacterium RIFCSPHIGHO2_12_FULL_54_23]|uniref:Isoleucine--tRNA ligase n=3 Tax=Candidatus Uhriibacteriota TaxID=1752732 RepID=A0A1F7UG31_9BACT|nr:MAG: hypothetical protein A3J43_04370 [Candidatus Uhrbacteria bacterium RIFCSPHIGHO2_12_FULL_54_23]OGL85601.1 MAG: hypothetical protein A3B36_02735 [Candidatus Uhrbacteria bacterium RIFCSPLOWO2_01_FULL_55_36]OGL89709.1 MAG: hypothetical protein A3J36_00160 [Candidatus Uhrbacteria bacterium RIFCSPLOWO2_02_FULL_54_37]
MSMNLLEQELKVLEWWRREKVFERSVDKPSPKGDFVFYEGPPTANGRPGIHHVISRQFKDIIPRFKTMQGYRVVRKGGWDTHGLPVELEVEKQLGLKNKKEVEAYGIAAFNKKCKESVWKYKEDWERFTERIAYWLDIKNPYVTYEGSYIDGLWAVIKKFWERGLLIEGHKVVPHCPRCGTALSSHELAQGYQTVSDKSVYVMFKLKNSKFKVEGDIYILSWTTTPWTLPGNVALAVGKEIEYVVVRIKNKESGMTEYVIVAKERLSIVEGEYEAVQEIKGDDLVGLEYEPLFDIPALKFPTSYKVYAADFVSTADGTGVVHTAVMYGEDDYQLGAQVGLPKVHTVAEDGTFVGIRNEELGIMGELAGRFVKDPGTERMIIEYLEGKGLVFKKEYYEHDYPFCWRCKTPLLYYAKHSWFVAMSKLRNELIEANNQINWVPGYIKEGRFGEWLREVKDWAFSRERYWGTPLPIWTCQIGNNQSPRDNNQISNDNSHPEPVEGSLHSGRDDKGGCGRIEVIGSVAELVQKSKLNNRYIFMRHGEAETNVRSICNGVRESSIHFPLTERGEEQASSSVSRLISYGADMIITSPFVRTKATADAVGAKLKLAIETDERLREIAVGEYEGKTVDEAETYFSSVGERFVKQFPGGESYGDILARMQEALQDYETRYQGKTILIVSHGDPLWVLLWTLAGSPGKLEDFPYPQLAQPVMADHGVFLTDERGELDLHRPRVDQIELPCSCGGVMRRVPEVADVWFDSGAMPFVQYEENVEALGDTPPFVSSPLTRGEGTHQTPLPKKGEDGGEGVSTLKQFPADYIAEAIDQTRGWFYTLLAVSVALGKGTPFKNVICLGHILDAKGKKMSKSLGNIVVPSEMFEKYGVDAVRWYLFTMNDPGLPKRFNERELQEVVKKFFMILWNVVLFHELYPAAEGAQNKEQGTKRHVLDKWIVARVSQLIKLVTERLEAYDITPAGRAIQEFVTDLSTWYVRRSRERMKSGDEEARQTLRLVLIEAATLIAPFVPFTAEALWGKLQRTRNKEQGTIESVHLADWPKAGEIDLDVLNTMAAVRKIVEAGLAARAAAKMPIRQPLQCARIRNLELGIKEEYIEILKDELNVKEVIIEKGAGELAVELDTNLTEELKLEGMKRELIRAVNNLRKAAKLTIQDTIAWELQRTPATEKVVEAWRGELLTATLATAVTLVNAVQAGTKGIVKLGEEEVGFGF